MPDIEQKPEFTGFIGNFVLTPENYYSDEANKRFLSNSLFKSLYGYPAHPHPCQAAAVYGGKETTEALLVGSYMDAWFESTNAFEDFCREHENQIYTKSGKTKYKFIIDADNAINRVRKDKTFMRFMGGSHQTVLTGTIAGHPFKIKMDAYHPGEMIVDLKYVKSSMPVWNEVLKQRVSFIEDYGYTIQGAIYQEVEYQNSGKKLPFYIAYVTKDAEPDFGVVQIPQELLDEALEFVKINLTAKPYQSILMAPKACGRRSCPYCRKNKKLSGPMDWKTFTEYIAS